MGLKGPCFKSLCGRITAGRSMTHRFCQQRPDPTGCDRAPVGPKGPESYTLAALAGPRVALAP